MVPAKLKHNFVQLADPDDVIEADEHPEINELRVNEFYEYVDD